MIGILKSSYKFVRIFPFFYWTFFDAKKAKISFPFYRSLSPSSFFSFHVSTFIFLLIIDNLCERRNYSDFYYHAQLWNNVIAIILGNLNIYVVKLKKSENNSAPSWVWTRALVVRRLERRPLTCETIPTALRLHRSARFCCWKAMGRFQSNFWRRIRISLSRQDFEIFEVMCSKNGGFRYFWGYEQGARNFFGIFFWCHHLALLFPFKIRH